MPNVISAALLIFAAFLIALGVLIVFGMLDRRRVSELRHLTKAERGSVVFIFEDEALIDATRAARQLLDTMPRHGSDWTALANILAPRFPDLKARMGELADLGDVCLDSTDGRDRLTAEWHDGVARIVLDTIDGEDAQEEFDVHSLTAMKHELEALRTNADNTPYPLWRETSEGAIVWCNAAYLDLVDALREPDELPAWPPAPIFGAPDASDATPVAPNLRRVAISAPGDPMRHWFEVTATPLENGDTFQAAVPADMLVRAETSLDEFVTTLTKTFAALPIGLAIFDRSRQLALFNPALMDLIGLPADFLVSKPALSTFLDRLREARVMPEPKDYRSWRQQMSDLEAAAQNGTYEETWSLPAGQTYRVTGRPHPDGAVALLFEDISAEMTVTRRFRAELETGQAALDALPQGVAVFTPAGVLSITNAAYADIWNNDPGTSLGDVTIADAITRWRAQSAPSPVWDKVRASITQAGPREAWEAQVQLLSGQGLRCRVTPLAHGATMVGFLIARRSLSAQQGQVPELAAAKA